MGTDTAPGTTETPKRRLSDLFADRVDIVDQPANQSKFLIVKRKGAVEAPPSLLDQFMVEGEVDLDSTAYIEKAETTELQAVNAALQILRPVARGVDGKARTSLVQAIRVLEVGFKISPPAGEVQAPAPTQPKAPQPFSQPTAPKPGAAAVTPPTQPEQMRKSEGADMTEQEIKDLVQKAVAAAIPAAIEQVEKAKQEKMEAEKAKCDADKAMSETVKKAVEEALAPVKKELEDVKKAQMGGQASASGDAPPKVTDAGKVTDGKLPPAGGSNSIVVTKEAGAGADGMGGGGETGKVEKAAGGAGAGNPEMEEIKKSVGALKTTVDGLVASLSGGNGTTDGQETVGTEKGKVEKSEKPSGMWGNVLRAGKR